MHKYTSFIKTTIISVIFVFSNAQLFSQTELRVAAECTEDYFHLLKGRNIAIVANQTSVIKNVHLVDSLKNAGFTIKKIFSPEHGFRGTADAGEHVKDGIDVKTGIPIVSLYGNHKQPTAEDMQGIDLVIFDVQDVGVRFYTYISTMHYVMEACAEFSVDFMVLDRPNPNGFYVDGPILDPEYSSFVGMHPIPIVHGLTIGEYAKMIVGEGWLKTNTIPILTIILCDGYTHSTRYIPPIPPSPNLQNLQSILLYPALCLTEGTVLSCGRGTPFPFQVIGHPEWRTKTFSFTPKSIEGVSKNPPYKDVLCYGIDLQNYPTDTLTQIPIHLFLKAYNEYAGSDAFFNQFFTKLAGSPDLQFQIETGLSEDEIRKSWVNKLNKYMEIRKKYLLYADF